MAEDIRISLYLEIYGPLMKRVPVMKSWDIRTKVHPNG